jgi:hypothetical protein
MQRIHICIMRAQRCRITASDFPQVPTTRVFTYFPEFLLRQAQPNAKVKKGL